MWGYLKKVGIFFRKCGDFEKNKKWGFVGIFASGGGDFQSESSGSTVSDTGGVTVDGCVHKK